MDMKVYSTDGEPIHDIDLEESVFAVDVSEGAIWHAIRHELANMRQGTSKTKTRREVKGSTAKPWRQKGTGRARAGRRKSPLWRGGGVIFGPTPRDYSYSLPRKIKRLAIKSILSLKAADTETFRIVEDFAIESGKTRDLTAILKNFPAKGRTVLVLGNDDNLLKRAGRNIKDVAIFSYNRLRAHDLYYGNNIIVFEDAVKKLGEFYGEPE